MLEILVCNRLHSLRGRKAGHGCSLGFGLSVILNRACLVMRLDTQLHSFLCSNALLRTYLETQVEKE